MLTKVRAQPSPGIRIHILGLGWENKSVPQYFINSKWGGGAGSGSGVELANADIDTMNGIIPGRRLLSLSA